MRNWRYSPAEIFNSTPVVPVLVIDDVADALPIADALIAGGINVLEVTLRTPAALDVIATIAQHRPDAMVGAGTVTNSQELNLVAAKGAKFAISPGLTAELLAAGNVCDIALIPGISAISDLMRAQDAGYDHLKFFPAEAVGGVKAIKAIAGPFPNVTFCPTGGINLDNYNDYLALNNVACVGGSWLVPADAVKSKDWGRITELAKEAVAKAQA